MLAVGGAAGDQEKVPPGSDATAVILAAFPEHIVGVPLTFTSGV